MKMNEYLGHRLETSKKVVNLAELRAQLHQRESLENALGVEDQLAILLHEQVGHDLQLQ